jgi:hypothetical protein
MFPQPFEVELVDQEWWGVLIPLVGPFVIALGALGGAWLTIRTADKRHREQLEHDQQLQQQRLEHDRQLRSAELEHDRTLRYREQVYRVLDDVIERTQDLVTTFNRWDDKIIHAEADRSEFERRERETESQASREAARKSRLDSDVDLLYERAELYRSLASGWADNIRLRLRLGSHQVVVSHHELLEALEARLEAVDQDVPPVRNRNMEQVEADEQLMAQIGRHQSLFLKACEEWHLDSVGAPGSADAND